MVKRAILAVVIASVLAVPAMADYTNGVGWSGGTGKYTRLGSYYAGRGGEFTLFDDATTSLTLTTDAYVGSTKNQSTYSYSFQTFCLEVTETATTPMKLWVSEAAAASPGTWGSGSHAWDGGANTNLGDDLDPFTAWLYTEFATGSLTNYAYSGSVNGLNRAQTAGALQRLIWNIEGEGGLLTSGSSFYDITLTAGQASLIAAWQTEYAASNWSGIGNVRVLQVSTSAGGMAQDFLYLKPVPVPGAVLLGVLGMGVAGLRLRRRTER